jgi:hypothetical protein
LVPFSFAARIPVRAWLAAAAGLAVVAITVNAQTPPPVPVQDKPVQDVKVAGDAIDLDKKIIEMGKKENSEVMANITYLSDVIGPRLTGSDNLKRANDWTAEKMKSYGLTNVHLEPWTIPLGWERGTATAKLLEPDNGRSLTVAAYGWSPNTKGKIVGDVVIIRNQADLAKHKGKLKNAIVLTSPPSEQVQPLDAPRGAGGGGRGGRGGRGGKAADKAGDKAGGAQPPAGGDQQPAQPFRGGRGGGVGADVLQAEGVGATLTDSAKPHGLLNMTGNWPRNVERANSVEGPARLFIVHEHYALLWRLASRPEPAVTRVEFEVTNKFTPGPVTVYNTVGEIRGSEKPDEYVVCGAHLDSWDLAQGTTDNGTGSMTVLETARILGKAAAEGHRPRRTIRFILFTGEEEGLWGSKRYVETHAAELPKISAAFINDTGTGRVVGTGAVGVAAIKDIFDRELVSLKDLGVTISAGRGGGGGGGGSDHASFNGVGVPGIIYQQDRAEYTFTHHSQSDTLDKAREPDLIQCAQVMAICAIRVANLDSLLPRNAGGGN